jgi:hypothetical protein
MTQLESQSTIFLLRFRILLWDYWVIPAAFLPISAILSDEPEDFLAL